MLGPQQLDRHQPVQNQVGGPPDLTHATGSDAALQPVAAREYSRGV
jgi:hypothetical protein